MSIVGEQALAEQRWIAEPRDSIQAHAEILVDWLEMAPTGTPGAAG
jgi:hypothetical protein